MAITAVGEYEYFGYTGGIQTFTAPMNGIYYLQVIGARGGTCMNYNTATQGLGGYGNGYVKLNAGDVLYICVGGKGTNGGGGYGYQHTPAGGYNGGGNGGFRREWIDPSGWCWGVGAGGGGATHIAKVSGTLAQIGAANKDKILIVAGGGGGEVQGSSNDYTIGNGGGEKGTDGGGYSGDGGGTQSSGYAFGQGGHGLQNYEGWSQQGDGGGGGGLYGGKGGWYSGIPYSGSGGSGYIGGVPSFTYNGTTYSPTWTTGYSSATGNGGASITLVAKSTLPIIYNGTTLEKIIYNGTEITSLIYNGTKLF